MMRRNLILCCMLAMLSFLSACQSVFNPYDDSFQCPDINEGTCTSIPVAYRRSFDEEPQLDKECTECSKKMGKEKNPLDEAKIKPSEDSKNLYLKKRFEKLNTLIDTDRPPIVVPPEVVRVLVLSYTGRENEMFGFRYIYFFATEPSWLLSTTTEDEQGDN